MDSRETMKGTLEVHLLIVSLKDKQAMEDIKGRSAPQLQTGLAFLNCRCFLLSYLGSQLAQSLY